MKEAHVQYDRDLRDKAKIFNKDPSELHAENLIKAERKIEQSFNPNHQGKQKSNRSTDDLIFVGLKIMFFSYLLFIAIRPWFCGLTGNC